ncbi:hypothetical protein F5I97DRAFT_845083 [Phlebopus sp. FC_14]|nr:hypothetical protein F5I97DRAFT_845083 [Phlebopus sp. FC_14]
MPNPHDRELTKPEPFHWSSISFSPGSWPQPCHQRIQVSVISNDLLTRAHIGTLSPQQSRSWTLHPAPHSQLQLRGSSSYSSKPVYCVNQPADEPRLSQVNIPRSLSPARRFLNDARQITTLESEQLGRDVTVMDLILDHRLLVMTRVAEIHPPDRRHRTAVPPIYVFKCQHDIDAYWQAQHQQQQQRQEGEIPCRPANEDDMVLAHQLSAERSTLLRPPGR